MFTGEILNYRKNGELFPESLTITAVRNEQGVTTHYVANFIDIGARKDAETLIHRLAYFDPLTGLPNRRQLEETLRRSLSDATRTGRLGALLFLDIDNFKLLNDTRGHLVGDALLSQVAQRLRGVVREADTVARLGGDEFVVLLVGLDGEVCAAAAEAESVGLKLLEVFQRPFSLDSGEFACTCSIGVTVFGDRVQVTEEENRALADMALKDSLTQLGNRRSLQQAAQRLRDAARQSTRFAVLMIDIDHFKSINDQYGHDRGDNVLADVARCIQQAARQGDYAIRYGGEEFAVILDQASCQQATAVAERLHQQIRAARPAGLAVTVSIGVAMSADALDDLFKVINDADEALYLAKRQGRNRTVCAPGHDPGELPSAA